MIVIVITLLMPCARAPVPRVCVQSKKAAAEKAVPEVVKLGPVVKEGEIVFGVCHIYASFNDTFVHVTDLSGRETMSRVTGALMRRVGPTVPCVAVVLMVNGCCCCSGCGMPIVSAVGLPSCADGDWWLLLDWLWGVSVGWLFGRCTGRGRGCCSEFVPLE